MKKLSYQKVLRRKRYHTEHTQIGCPDAVHHPSYALRQKTVSFFPDAILYFLCGPQFFLFPHLSWKECWIFLSFQHKFHFHPDAWFPFEAGRSEGWMTRDHCLILHSGLILLWAISNIDGNKLEWSALSPNPQVPQRRIFLLTCEPN